MWVKSAVKIMTEHSGQPNPAETLQRTLAEHSQEIHAHGSTLQTLLDRQWQTNQQLEHLASLFQGACSPKSAAPIGGAAEPLAPQQQPHSRDVTSPHPEKFSREVGGCHGFLLQCKLVFNRSPRMFSHDEGKVSYILGLLTGGRSGGRRHGSPTAVILVSLMKISLLSSNKLLM
ncbi:hypothetical protein AMECASPLE_035862 [Ameca splendens]|uniref:Uncharacterized protein n=1 Tax=Ameca splendens TaxID=208324 RepID=A0ABV1A3T7_9TELE